MGTGLVVCCLARVLSNSKNASSGPGESGGVAMTFDPGRRLNCRKPQDSERAQLSLSRSFSLSFSLSLPLFPVALLVLFISDAEGHTIALGPIVVVRFIARVFAIDLAARNRSISSAISPRCLSERDTLLLLLVFFPLSLSLSLSLVRKL